MRIAALLAIPLLVLGPAAAAEPADDLDACLAARAPTRLARMVGPGGRAAWVRVESATDGVPTTVVPVADGGADLAAAFVRAEARADAEPWTLAPDDARRRTCSPVPLDQSAIDAERAVVVAAGLNYRAHADEVGGGEVFLFPKPAAPTSPYGEVAPPAGVTLLDYEVELGFVLLADLPLDPPPSREALLASTAFFVANDVSDREPIVREKALRGPGTGFARGKGQDGFLPAGPWLVRGRELFDALAACGAAGLALALDVDEGDGFRPRQRSTHDRMILDPEALVRRIADTVAAEGLRSPMPMERGGETRFYPLAVAGPDGPHLAAGSLVLTGTPDGIALASPSPPALVLRGLLRLRSPFEQFVHEEIERAAAGAPGGYLQPGHRVRAHVSGLGTQIVRIGRAGATPAPDPCAPEASR